MLAFDIVSLHKLGAQAGHDVVAVGVIVVAGQHLGHAVKDRRAGLVLQDGVFHGIDRIKLGSASVAGIVRAHPSP